MDPGLTRPLPIHRRRALGLLALAPLLAACRYPADVEGTLDAVQGREMKVGLLVSADMFHEMAEEEALTAAARLLPTTPVLVEGRAHDLVAHLEAGRVHLIAGGMPEDTPFANKLALSKPWGEASIGNRVRPAVWGIRKGENAFLLALNRAIAESRSAVS